MSGLLTQRGYSQLTAEELRVIEDKAKAASEFGPVVSPRMKGLAELGFSFIAPVVKRAITEHPPKKAKLPTTKTETPEPTTGEKVIEIEIPDIPYESMSMEQKIAWASKKRASLVQGVG